MKNITFSAVRQGLLAGVSLLVANVASAQDNWYLVQSQVGNNHWNQITISDSYKTWADAPNYTSYTGNESHYATEMDPLDNYYVIGATKSLRTTSTSAAGTYSFQGGVLIMDHSIFVFKNYGSAVASASHLRTSGATFSTGGANNTQHRLTVDTFSVEGTDATVFSAGDGNTGRGTTLTLNNLIGSGAMNFTSGTSTGTNFTLNLTNANLYTGAMILNAGTLTLDTSFTSNGALNLNAGALVLNGAAEYSSAAIGATQLAAGTYTAAQLTLAGFTTTGLGTLTVVPEPSGMVLVVSSLAAVLLTNRRRRA